MFWQPCGALRDSKVCSGPPCAINCELSPWSSYSSCTKTCGGGQRQRVRRIVKPAQHGGAKCGNLTEITKCNTNACPGDCQVPFACEFVLCFGGNLNRLCHQVGSWSEWSKCTSCNSTQTRSRNISSPAVGDGKGCPPLVVSLHKQSVGAAACS